MILSFRLSESGDNIDNRRASKAHEVMKLSYHSLIWFVWLWECSRGHSHKKVGFHKIMQMTVSGAKTLHPHLKLKDVVLILG